MTNDGAMMGFQRACHAKLLNSSDDGHAKNQPADDIEGVGIKLALYIYMSGVDPETADSAVE